MTFKSFLKEKEIFWDTTHETIAAPWLWIASITKAAYLLGRLEVWKEVNEMTGKLFEVTKPKKEVPAEFENERFNL